MLKKIKVSHVTILVMFLVLSYIFGIIQFKNNIIINNFDTSFQMKRVLGLSNVFSSPINFGTFPQPINIFYGWLTLYPAYLIYWATNNLVLAYNGYLYLLTFCTLISAYVSVYGINKNKFISMFFSILYTFSMYRTLCIFYRGAMGEVIAMAIYPLIFSAMYNIIVNKKNYWVRLGVSFSLLFYTHVLSAFIAFGFIVIIYISVLLSRVDNKKNITITFFKAGLNALVLSLPFLVPLVEQTFFQKISTPAIFNLNQGALSANQLVIGSLKEDLSSNSIGLIILFLACLSIIFIRRFNTQLKYIFVLGLITFLGTSKIFLWQFLQETPIKIIQFPYRLMGISTLFLCFTSSYLIYSFTNSKRMKVIMMSILIVGVSLLNVLSIKNSTFINRRINESNVISEVSNAFNNDYKPIGYEKYEELTSKQQIIINGKFESFESEQTDSLYKGYVRANNESIVTLPLYNYKGVHVMVNGEKANIIKNNNPMVSVKVDQGDNLIEVSYKYTILTKIAVLLTIIWILLLFYVWRKNGQKLIKGINN